MPGIIPPPRELATNHPSPANGEVETEVKQLGQIPRTKSISRGGRPENLEQEASLAEVAGIQTHWAEPGSACWYRVPGSTA